MVVEFFDQHGVGEYHARFQDWRRTHTRGYFLTFTAKHQARLHETLCLHPGDVDWTYEESGSSLTMKRKVCADDEASLGEWAMENGVVVSRCKDCLRLAAKATHRSRPLKASSPKPGLLGDAVPSDELCAFSWGYWGWGNAVPELLAAVDAAEAAEGRQPPVFADVRLRRSVRAIGFREAAFEEAVGVDRYRWLNGLGNVRIDTHQGGVQLAKPRDAERLLDLVIEQAQYRRRVIFFCACATDSDFLCHRHTVARVLLKAARARQLRLTVVEWPGGEPAERTIELDAIQGKRAMGASIPLGSDLPKDGLATLPWGSTVRLRQGKDEHLILSGPAFFSGEWKLPVIATQAECMGIGRSLEAEARHFRRKHLCNERRS